MSPLWLVVSYLLQTLGELCLSPVGLSAMSTLAPARIAGLMMGVWFLALSVGNYLAGMASSVYETMPLPTLFTLVTATAARGRAGAGAADQADPTDAGALTA